MDVLVRVSERLVQEVDAMVDTGKPVDIRRAAAQIQWSSDEEAAVAKALVGIAQVIVDQVLQEFEAVEELRRQVQDLARRVEELERPHYHQYGGSWTSVQQYIDIR